MCHDNVPKYISVQMPVPFDNTYTRLPPRFYARLGPTPVAAPRLIRLNTELAEYLGLDPEELATPEGVEILAGNRVPERGEPIALAYAGHQFGHFVPQLGDGRAILQIWIELERHTGDLDIVARLESLRLECTDHADAAQAPLEVRERLLVVEVIARNQAFDSRAAYAEGPISGALHPIGAWCRRPEHTMLGDVSSVRSRSGGSLIVGGYPAQELA